MARRSIWRQAPVQKYGGILRLQGRSSERPNDTSAGHHAKTQAAHGSSELVAYSLDRLSRAVGELLRRAVVAEEIRADVDPEDLLRALVGMCYAHDRPGWQAKVLRLIDIFIDGLHRSPDKRHNR